MTSASVDLVAELRRILDAKAFTETELDAARRGAVDARGAADDGALRVATGYVVLWKGGRTDSMQYWVGIDGRALRVTWALFDVLCEGAPYRVYFTHDWVRAIEPASLGDVHDAVAEAARAAGSSRDDPGAAIDPRVVARLKEELEAAFQRNCGFSAEDLAQNKAGALSPATRQKVQQGTTSHFVMGAVLIGFVVLIAAMMKNPPWGFFVGAGLALLIAGAFIKRGIVYAQAVAQGGVEGALAAMTGKVITGIHSETVWLETEAGHSLTLDRRVFAVHGFHPDALRALRYRCFFVPGTQIVLSLEIGPDLSPLFRSPK